MGAFSIWHWLIVLVIAVVLFGGKGKLSSILGDLGKGLKDFKKNVADDTPEQKKKETVVLKDEEKAEK